MIIKINYTYENILNLPNNAWSTGKNNGIIVSYIINLQIKKKKIQHWPVSGHKGALKHSQGVRPNDTTFEKTNCKCIIKHLCLILYQLYLLQFIPHKYSWKYIKIF